MIVTKKMKCEKMTCESMVKLEKYGIMKTARKASHLMATAVLSFTSMMTERSTIAAASIMILRSCSVR